MHAPWRASEIWQTAIRAHWDGVERRFHGDLARGNMLLADGCLAAMVDFGTCGVGDPACDLAIAWTLLTTEGRQAFRRRLSVDDDEWATGAAGRSGRRSPCAPAARPGPIRCRWTLGALSTRCARSIE